MNVADAKDVKIAELQREIARLKALIDRDRTGLARALNVIRDLVKGWRWIPAGEWGSYPHDERTEEVLRAEVGTMAEAIETVATTSLRYSGALADAAAFQLRPPPVEKDPAERALLAEATLTAVQRERNHLARQLRQIREIVR